GNIAVEQGDYAAARALYEECLEIKGQLGDRRGVAASLAGLGTIAACEAKYPAAREFHTEALSIRRHLGDKRGTAASLRGLALVLLEEASSSPGSEVGDPGPRTPDLGLDEAAALMEESLQLRRELGDKSGIAASLAGLGEVAQARGDREGAGEFFRESLGIYHELGNRRGVAGCLKALGQQTAGEDPRRAAQRLGAAEALPP